MTVLHHGLLDAVTNMVQQNISPQLCARRKLTDLRLLSRVGIFILKEDREHAIEFKMCYLPKLDKSFK